jgi:hypothetical protein
MAGQAPQQQARKPNLLDRILGLYGADPATHIPQEQRKGALGEGLFQAGLQTVMAGGRGHDSLTPGQAIGSMLGGMRQQGPRMAGQQRMNKIREMAQNGMLSPQQLQAIMMELIASGSTEEAKVVASVLNSLASEGGNMQRFSAINPKTGKPELAWADPRAPVDSVQFSGLSPVRGEGANLQLQQLADEETGEVGVYMFDPSGGGNFTLVKGLKPLPRKRTELEQRAGMFVPLSEMAEDAIRAFEGAPTRMEQLAEVSGINELQSPEGQMLYAAGRQIGDAYLRLTSGAAIKEEEVHMFIRSFLPYPGDTNEVMEYKRRARAVFVQELKKIANGSSYHNTDTREGREALQQTALEQAEKGATGTLLPLPPGGEQYVP